MKSNHELPTFNYKIFRKKRKTIGIKITNKGEVIVTSPFGISDKIIEDIVKKKSSWILGKLNIIKSEKLEEKTSLKNGYKLLYLGIQLKLELFYEKPDNCNFFIDNESFKVYFDGNIGLDEDGIKNHIIEIYKKQAKKVLIERTKIYSKLINANPLKVTIKSQKTLWGSCSSKRNINYNYKIIMAPIEVVDYLVVHELCHLIHMNHSKQYWSTVQSILPDYKIRRRWLKDNGFKLMRYFE
ncbi:SprT family zinc-dependent metalloprotease [Clostridium sp. JS66]|uniref:M48 family metallopeptidase n=1 Tax=Clostridium sp. JS66 TaxID=3064705 RepID=UPI00298E31D5|nr:SprT family zinc-dependent metalloprotease [Clostridium sp. JS66]WPC42264.1 SprT family zinc-dependent metalloprotease [Clostridium sp. JS66]